MDITILEELGLTQSEVKIYLTLLELGSSSAGHILEKSRLQNSVMHRALNTLIEKGLINYILEGRRKIYQATDPENFYNFMDEKKRRFDEILPDLKQKQEFAEVKESAAIYKGIRGIKEVYSILRNAKAKEYITFGGGHPCVDRMGATWWINHHLKRIKNKLPARQVWDITVVDFGEEKFINHPLTNVKYLPAEFAHFQETAIVGEYVAITLFTENPYSILIKDKGVADGYRKHFEIMWKQAKPLKEFKLKKRK